MEYREQLKKVRKDKKLTMKELGEILGLKGATICSWEKGYRTPSVNNLENWAEALGLKLMFSAPKSDDEISEKPVCSEKPEEYSLELVFRIKKCEDKKDVKIS